MAFTFCRFGFHSLLVRMWEWLTFIPVRAVLPQISQIDMVHLL